MSLRAFQSALVDLYKLPTVRAAVYSGLSEWNASDLTPHELRSLCGIDRDRLEWFCEGLMNRDSRLRKSYPETEKRIGARFEAIFREFYAEHAHVKRFEEKFRLFSSLLFEKLVHDSIAVKEIARFEFTKTLLAIYLNTGDVSLLEGSGLTAYPRGSMRVAFSATFAYDVLQGSAHTDGYPTMLLFFQTQEGAPLQERVLEGQ